MTVGQLAYLDELIAHDEAAAQSLAELDDLRERVSALRARAEDVRRDLEQGPAEVERCVAESRDALANLDAARSRLETALLEETRASETDDEARLREAEHRALRERDSVRLAEKRVAATEVQLREWQAQLRGAEAERPLVEEAATRLSRSLAGRARLPASVSVAPAGIDRIGEWAVEARAALFVARSAVATEREQAIRQAGELGALITGGPVAASSMETLATVIREAAGP